MQNIKYKKNKKLDIIIESKSKKKIRKGPISAIASTLRGAPRKRIRLTFGVKGVGTSWGSQKKLFYGLVLRRYLSMLPASQSRRLLVMFHYFYGKKWNPRMLLASLRLLVRRSGNNEKYKSKSLSQRLFVISHCFRGINRPLRLFVNTGDRVALRRLSIKRVPGLRKRMSFNNRLLLSRSRRRRPFKMKARRLFIFRRLLSGVSLRNKMKWDRRVVSKMLRRLRFMRLLRNYKLSVRRLVFLRSSKIQRKFYMSDFLVTRRFRRLKRYFLSRKFDSLYRHLLFRKRRFLLKKIKSLKMRRRRFGFKKSSFLGRRKRFVVSKQVLRTKMIRGVKSRKLSKLFSRFKKTNTRLNPFKSKKSASFVFRGKFRKKWSDKKIAVKNRKGRGYFSRKYHKKSFRLGIKRNRSYLYLQLRRYFVKQLNRFHKQKLFSYKRFSSKYSLLPSINKGGIRYWKYYFYSRMLLSPWNSLNVSFLNEKIRMFRRFMLRGKLNRLGYFGKEYCIRKFASVSLRTLFLCGLISKGGVILDLLPTKMLVTKCESALSYARNMNTGFLKNKQWYKLTGEQLPYHRLERDRSTEALSLESPTTVVANTPLMLREPYRSGVASVYGLGDLRNMGGEFGRLAENVSHLNNVNYYGQRAGSFYTRSTKSGKVSSRANKLLYV